MARVKLENVRIAFPSLWRKATFGGGTADEKSTKFEATFLINKSDTETLAKIKGAINQALIKKYGDKESFPPGITSSGRCCFRNGDDVAYDGFAGHMSLKCANKVRPSVINRDKSALTEEDGVVYGGCYVNVSFDIWIQDNSYGKKVNANLYAVQFAGDGEPFGAGSIPEGIIDDFDEIEGSSQEVSDVLDDDLDMDFDGI